MHTLHLITLLIASAAAAPQNPSLNWQGQTTDVSAKLACNPNDMDGTGVFPAGAFKCLTDVTYTICNGGLEIQQFVAAGTRCQQGQRCGTKDQILGEVATKLEVFTQQAPCPSAHA